MADLNAKASQRQDDLVKLLCSMQSSLLFWCKYLLSHNDDANKDNEMLLKGAKDVLSQRKSIFISLPLSLSLSLFPSLFFHSSLSLSFASSLSLSPPHSSLFPLVPLSLSPRFLSLFVKWFLFTYNRC